MATISDIQAFPNAAYRYNAPEDFVQNARSQSPWTLAPVVEPPCMIGGTKDPMAEVPRSSFVSQICLFLVVYAARQSMHEIEWTTSGIVSCIWPRSKIASHQS